jgi:E3 ubiquitin-protein ligase SIAH1
MEYMVPPIQLCKNGHSICSKCSQNAYFCPTCGAEPSNTRNVHLENIVRGQKYPCANRPSGCLDLFSIEQIAEHQAVCSYGPVECPLKKLNVECPWKGVKSDLEEHAKAVHPEYFVRSSTHTSPWLDDDRQLVLCFGEVFLYNQRIRDGTFHCVVQLIGPRSQASKYKCEFQLRAANGIEQISKTFTVRSYEEDSETSFSSGKCSRLHDVVVTNFAVEHWLDMTVTISKE